MKIKRLLSLFIVLTLALPLIAGVSKAEGESWVDGDYWALEHLLELGAEAPDYNADTKQYEISRPEQLLFLSGEWKADDTNGDGQPDAPRDGSYLLMNDIDMAPYLKTLGKALSKAAGHAVTGYLPPISANKENKATETDGYFMGTFDGGNHAIKNHVVRRMQGEYGGLFGYLGYKQSKCYIKNLAVLNIDVAGLEDCGALCGGNYATVQNCVLTGKVSAEAGAGGLSSSIKAGGGDFYGLVENCFVDVDVTCSEETGALTGKIAGKVVNTFVLGSVTGADFDSAGGLAGLYDAGVGVENVMVATPSVTSQDGGKKVDRFVGSLEGDSGLSFTNNYAFAGTQLSGRMAEKHPDRAVYELISAAEIQQKSTYTERLQWDFDTVWTWIGADDAGYPMLAAFAETVPNLEKDIASSLTVASPVLAGDNPVVDAGFAGEETKLTATLTLPDPAAAATVELLYGASADALDQVLAMAPDGEGRFAAVFPESAVGSYFYAYRATVGKDAVTYPADLSAPVPLVITERVIDAAPMEISVSPGVDPSGIGFNFLTSPDGEKGAIRYRAVGDADWIEVPTESYLSYIDEGWQERMSHWVDVNGLLPDTDYEYTAVGFADGREFVSPAYTFTTLPGGEDFSMLVISDLQTETAEGYEPFMKSYEEFIVPELGAPDLVLTLGDNVEDSFKDGEWENFFNACGALTASTPFAILPGNHEYSGDLFYKNFTSRTNLPGGIDNELIGEYTGYFIVGDACIVMPSTEVYTDTADNDQLIADRASYYELQKAWAEKIFADSGCRWRVIATHRGPYTVNHSGLIEVPEMARLADELNVDLYLNGHDHSYIRVTAKEGEKTEPGSGTNYLTCSPMGEKFDDFIPGVIDELVAVHAGSEAEELQKFALVKGDAHGLSVTVYQLAEPGEFTSYEVIDTVELNENLSGAPGRSFEAAAEPAEPAELAAEPAAASAPAKTAVPVLPIVLCLVVIAAVIVATRFIKCKKAAAAVKNTDDKTDKKK